MGKHLGLVFCLFSLTAFADGPKYPNVDSLSYWNRAMEMRDVLIVLKKKLVDAEGYLPSLKYKLEKTKRLYEKNATTQHELREHQWLTDDTELQAKEIREEIAEAELFEKLCMLRYQWAKEEKEEIVATIAATYTETWKHRALLNDIRLARARAELAHRQWIFETVQKLVVKNARTEDDLITARDIRDEVIGRVNMAVERAELARLAEKESAATNSLIR